jgi:hypothetical protein
LSARRPTRVVDGRAIVVMLVIPVLAPLGDITCHVQRPTPSRTRGESPHYHRRRTAVTGVLAVAAFPRIPLVAPRILASLRTTRRVLPLRLRRQLEAIMLTVSEGTVPAHVH